MENNKDYLKIIADEQDNKEETKNVINDYLLKCSSEDASYALNELINKVNLLMKTYNIENQEDSEKIEKYEEYLDSICKNSNINNQTDHDDDDGSTCKVDFLIVRQIAKLQGLISGYYSITNVVGFTKTNGEIQKAVDSIAEIKVKEVAKDIIDDQHRDTNNRLFTLLGVFTAIITIIMSAVITLSTWLNNAELVDVVYAILIPNVVTVCSVVSLLFIILLHTDIINIKKGNRIKTVFAIAFLIAIMVGIVFCVYFLLIKLNTYIPRM